jgi:hypothetical protein
MSLRTILMIAIVVLAIAWGGVFILTGAPNLILALATMGAGIGLAALSFMDGKKTKNGDEGE